MSEKHWTAEQTRKGWGIRYDPTPGGKKNADGTTSYSLSFIALELTDMVGEPHKAAEDIATSLNRDAAVDELLTAVDWLLNLYDAGEPIGGEAITRARAARDKARGTP